MPAALRLRNTETCAQPHTLEGRALEFEHLSTDLECAVHIPLKSSSHMWLGATQAGAASLNRQEL